MFLRQWAFKHSLGNGPEKISADKDIDLDGQVISVDSDARIRHCDGHNIDENLLLKEALFGRAWARSHMGLSTKSLIDLKDALEAW